MLKRGEIACRIVLSCDGSNRETFRRYRGGGVVWWGVEIGGARCASGAASDSVYYIRVVYRYINREGKIVFREDRWGLK